MKTLSTRCIILGHKNFGESHKFIHLYSQDLGKLRVMAKGASKITSKFTGHLETLNICMASLYFGPKNIILTEIITERTFRGLNDDLDKLRNAMAIAEITNQTVYENQQLDGLMELLEESLLKLCESTKPPLVAKNYSDSLLQLAGFLP